MLNTKDVPHSSLAEYLLIWVITQRYCAPNCFFFSCIFSYFIVLTIMVYHWFFALTGIWLGFELPLVLGKFATCNWIQFYGSFPKYLGVGTTMKLNFIGMK